MSCDSWRGLANSAFEADFGKFVMDYGFRVKTRQRFVDSWKIGERLVGSRSYVSLGTF